MNKSKTGNPHGVYAIARKRLAVFLALLLALSAIAVSAAPFQDSWTLGPYQLLNVKPISPLRMTMGGVSALRSGAFLGRVGGVAFREVATPDESVQGKSISLSYDRTKPDGERLIVSVDGIDYAQKIPDWVLLPIARYAASDHDACVSLLGEKTDEDYFHAVYHPALQNTLLGLRLMQADLLLVDVENAWELPKRNGVTVLGKGEALPIRAASERAASEIESLLEDGAPFDSWLITDTPRKVTLHADAGGLKILGTFYWYFWTTDTRSSEYKAFMKEAEPLEDKYDELIEQGKKSAAGDVLKQIDKLRENANLPVARVDSLTQELAQRWETVRKVNPALHGALSYMVRYGAFFRYVKASNQASWSRFLSQIVGVEPAPRVTTPTSVPKL